ncbi:MAG: chloramphenicol phosphotransferase CPT family protein [Chlamydiales bacterium]|nr:chloramphenicol phosphotransferase CPT family protein [Chlamydiales bacterium]
MTIRLIVALFLFASLPVAACQIIYLNGPSSVGKTTLTRALQNELKTPYMHIGIDKIIEMMPEKVNNWEGGTAELGFSWKKSSDAEGRPLQLLQMGSFAAQMGKAFRDVSAALAKDNFCLIIDDVAIEKDAFLLWKEALKGHTVLWVGLTAPLEVIEMREKARGDRQLGQARACYFEVHKGFTYDLMLDTSKEPTAELVKQITSACQSS